MKLDWLEALVWVQKTGSITGAAESMGLSAPAVSKKLTELERDLGTQLLERSTRKVQFTESGLAFLEQAEDILIQVEAAVNQAKLVQEKPRGRLHVIAFHHDFIVPHLKKFREENPDLELVIEFGQRCPSWNEEPLDILLGPSSVTTDGIVAKVIAHSTYVWVASTEYIKERGKPKKIGELRQHDLIAHLRRDQNPVFYSKDVGEFQLTPSLVVNDTKAMIDFALEGLGFCKIHFYRAKPFLEQGILQMFMPASEPAPIHLCYRYRKYPEPKVRAFIDFFAPLIRQQVEGV